MATRRLRHLVAGFLVIWPTVVAAGPPPTVDTGSAGKVERLTLPAVRGTCTAGAPDEWRRPLGMRALADPLERFTERGGAGGPTHVWAAGHEMRRRAAGVAAAR